MIFKCAGLHDSMTDAIYPDLNPTLCIFFQGCKFNCGGCHNPDLRAEEGGFEYDTDNIIDILNGHKGFYKSVTMTGGEPMLQPDAVYDIVNRATLPKVLYTGRDVIDIDLMTHLDVIKYGRYIDELKYNGFPSSTNQVVWRKHK